MKDFVSYEQALALKELGFDEPCLGFYDGKGDNQVYFNNLRDASGDFEPFKNNERLKWFGAPLYQQAFRWFREKHRLHSYIEGAYPWFRYIINSDDNQWEGFKHLVYEEAESACLDKLIEIVKNK